VRDLPTGTVTLLFTDIEGSTKLLQELGDRYADVLAEHRRVLREAFRSHGGVEVDTQGDAFFYAFAKAADALAAAGDGQAALSGGPVSVRVGVHTGEPTLTEEGYVGADVHRAARIMNAGHGGQVLVSEATQRLVHDRLPLKDLGLQRLKDLTTPERLYQLGKSDFPPLKTLNQTNLPVAASRLVGRERELAELVELLSDSHRIVTVTGAGGSGKTRLALQVAAELVGGFEDGVFWVSLAGLREPEIVLPAVAQAVGAKDELSSHLAHRTMLLLLDNFEHLLDAAAPLAELLAEAPRVKALITSRAALQVSGEREYVLDPLAEADAVALFLTRTRDAGRHLDPDETVLEICRRLDRLPLALELAAARAKLMGPEVLLSRLEKGLPLLTGGRRDAPERQRTLRAAIDWSYGLLEDRTKAVFSRLAVFAGGFALTAAEEIARSGLEELAELVDLSLLKPIGADRFLMLETIREYALERLEESSEAVSLREAHARFMLALLEEARPHIEGGARQREWVTRLAPELDNIRLALAFFSTAGPAESFVRCATAAWWCWWAQGNLTEPRVRLDEALASYQEPTALRADALEGAAYLAMRQGDLEEARHRSEERLAIWQSAEDPIALGNAIYFLGNLDALEGDIDEAERRWRRSLELFASHGYARYAFGALGSTAHQRGDFVEARRNIERSNDIARAVGDERMLVTHLAMIGLTYLDEADPCRALAPILESVRLGTTLHHAESVARTSLLATAALLVEDRAGDAVVLLGAADAALRMMNSVLIPFQRERVERVLERARELLGPDATDEAWNRGASLELDAAVDLAREALETYSTAVD
jgi:predicted ATPase